MRITLRKVYGDFQPTATVEIDDEEKAKELIRRGFAVRAKEQVVYGHEDEMPEEKRIKALEALEAADAAGGHRDQQARAVATAPWRKSA